MIATASPNPCDDCGRETIEEYTYYPNGALKTKTIREKYVPITDKYYSNKYGTLPFTVTCETK
jgi:hypothetical protein